MRLIGIALSGGGARAAAHIGVLQALNEHGIFPEDVSGSSAGSIIAALYCFGYTPLEILDLSHENEFLKIFKLGIFNKGVTELTFLKRFLEAHIHIPGHENPRNRLHVCMSNINSGKFEIASEGSFIVPLLASCALPLLFKPIVHNGYTYVDGGLLNNLPMEPLVASCDTVIGSSVCPHEERYDIRGRRNVGSRCFQLAIWNTVYPRLKQCDLALEIEDSYRFNMFDIKESKTLFEIGYESTLKKIPKLMEILEENR